LEITLCKAVAWTYAKLLDNSLQEVTEDSSITPATVVGVTAETSHETRQMSFNVETNDSPGEVMLRRLAIVEPLKQLASETVLQTLNGTLDCSSNNQKIHRGRTSLRQAALLSLKLVLTVCSAWWSMIAKRKWRISFLRRQFLSKCTIIGVIAGVMLLKNLSMVSVCVLS
jgi:hypothetical protein